MAILTYATYVPDTQIYCTGAPSAVVVDALRKSAATFFYKSLAYRIWLPVANLTINISTYALNAGLVASEVEVAQILRVYCQGVAVEPTTHDEFFARDPKWPTTTGSNPTHYTVVNTKDNFNITPVPTATVTGAFNVQVAVCPLLNSTGVEQYFFEEWKEQIIDGALARLLSIPGRQWTDVKESDRRHQRASMGATSARIQATKGNTMRDTTVQLRRWV